MDKLREEFEEKFPPNKLLRFNDELGCYEAAQQSELIQMILKDTDLLVQNVAFSAYKAAKASQWISIEDELPENATWVLIYTYSELTERRIVTMAFFESSNDELFWLSSRSDVDGWDRVTHWMPLPKGQSDD